MVASFGERLKKEREKRGMTLEDVAGVTKISVRNLRALEQEKFDQMPGGIFNRGFVRSYARHLGLDDEQVVADYMEAAGESVPAPDVSNGAPVPNNPPIQAQTPPEGAPDQVPWAALAGLVVLGTVLLGVWFYHSRHKTPEGPTMALETHHSPSPSAIPAEASKGPSSPEPALSSPSSGSRNETPGSASVAQAGFDVSLRAHDEVWLSTAVDGQPPSESTLEDGQSVVVHASNRAILRVGNAAALDVSFNGQKVPVHAAEGQVRTLTFTPTGLQVPVASGTSPN